MTESRHLRRGLVIGWMIVVGTWYVHACATRSWI